MPRCTPNRVGSRLASGLTPLLLMLLACATHVGTPATPRHTLTTAGIIAFYEGALKDAERLLRSAVNHDYGDTLARYYLAKTYLAEGGLEGRIAAEEVLGDLTAMVDREPLYLTALAKLRLRQGYRSNARRALEKLLALEPGEVSARFELGRLAEGDWWRFQALRDRELAVNHYRLVLDVDHVHSGANVRLAVLALEADSLELARQHVDHLLEHHPDEVSTILLDGVLLEYQGQFEVAQGAFERALERIPTHDRSAFEGPTFLEPDSSFVFGPILGGTETGETDPGENGRFWRRRDPTPATRVNERFVVHASRAAMADFIYGDPKENVRGWETAPGEFYIRYGKPVRRDYVLANAPLWIHTFRVGDDDVAVRFLDYSQNGTFMLPIEYDPAPLHATLKLRYPEDPHFEDRLPVVSTPHVASWFRTSEGEPKLEVAVAWTDEPRAYEAAVLDTSWTEIYHARQLVDPRRIPPSVPIPQTGLFGYTFYPGERAAHLQIMLGDERTVSADLPPPLPRKGFAVSDLVVGFASGEGFVPNPGYPITSSSIIGVDFEVYDVRLDALGVGYLDVTLSLVPHTVRRRALDSLLGSAGAPGFVTSTFEEEVTARDWRRVIEIDPGELEPGRYTVRLEVVDTLTFERVVRQRDVVIVG